ncbi:unnamed protein product [Clonostachys rosea]|uniref:DUF6603 domain-containing protein n=1 Tax=Bionectria ochroleuca TaxID=29856 RepID=A0ABY6U6A6_BIOOC|nr:unnamed protein product [Clonostachys rosea]
MSQTVTGLQVVSIHLNVGAGDGAIHLLTCDPLPSLNDTLNRRVILQAYMVDGGKQHSVELIDKAIVEIEKAFRSPYEYETNKNFLKFDGFIITHWDADHFAGLEAWVASQIVFEGTGKDKKKVLTRAHYKDGSPLTYAYSPWAWPGESMFQVLNGKLCTKKAADKAKKAKKPIRKRNPKKKNPPKKRGPGRPPKNPPKRGPGRPPKNPPKRGPGRPKKQVNELEKRHTGKDKDKDKDKDEDKIYDLAIARTQYNELIGRNIFRQHSEPKRDAKSTVPLYQAANLKDLLVKNAISNPDVAAVFDATMATDIPLPAMYCIAAERKDPAGGVHNAATPKNMSSLIFIVAWRNDKDTEHKVSHYFAGDAHIRLEQGVLGWIDPNYKQDSGNPSDYPITTMKLSHHGAHSSNPKQCYYQFQCKNIVVSAGDQYGHPTWQVVTDIHDWFLEKQNTNKVANPGVALRRPFFPCKWPYWMRTNHNGKDKTGKKKTKGLVNIQAPPGVFKKIIQKTKKTYNAANETRAKLKALRLLNPFLGCFKGEKVDWEKFLQVVRDLMPIISVLSVGFTGSIDCLIPIGTNSPSTTFESILAFQVNSSFNSQEDGKITVLGCDRAGTDFPVNCSIALLTARGMRDVDDYGEDDNPSRTVDTFPYKGFDQPRVIDITDGVPDWDKIRALDKRILGSEDTTAYTADSIDDSELSEVDDDWDDLGDSVSVASFTSSFSAMVSNAGSDLNFSKTPSKVMVCFQEVSPDILVLAAKVYLACVNEKDPKSPLEFPRGSKEVILDPVHVLSGFLNTLHLQSIGLAEFPSQTNSVPLNIDDEVFQWFARFTSLGAPEPTPVVVPDGFALCLRPVSEWPITNFKDTKLDFEMTVPYLKGPHLRFSTDIGAALTFSQLDEADSNQLKKVSADALNEMLVNRRTLVFGLEGLSAPLKTTLSDLATFMRVDMLSSPLFKFLAGGLALTLDTSQDFHNAIWFRPSMSYETIMRLQFHVEAEGLNKFNKWLSILSPSLQVKTLRVIGRKNATWVWAVPYDKMVFTSSITFLCRMSIPSSSLELEGVFTCSDTSVSLTLTLNEATVKTAGSESAMGDVMKWLADNFEMSDQKQFDEVIGKAKASETGIMDGKTIIPRRITVEIGLNSEGEITGVNSVSIDIETCLTIGRSAGDEMPIIFLFTVGWTKTLGFHLVGKLWSVIPETPFAKYERALPKYEEYQNLVPVSRTDPKNQMRTIDISRLISNKTGEGEVKGLPAGIPNEIQACEISLSQKQVSFTGRIRCSKPVSDNPDAPPMPPTISLEKVDLAASYTWGTANPDEDGFYLSLGIEVDLFLGGEFDEDKDEDEQYDNVVKLTGEVTYDHGDWSIEASVSNLSILHLLQFWDVDDRSAISELLGGIHLDFVTVSYEFNNGKDEETGALIDDGTDPRAPSVLLIEGQFTFSSVATLTFDYVNEGGDYWALRAGLGPSETTKKSATIGALLKQFMDPLDVNSLPDAIRDANIGGAEDEEPLQILVAKSDGISVFALLIEIGKISVWFIQLRSKDGAVKRILKAAISKISVDVSPFQTTINSPWEEFFFMWVQDRTETKEGSDALTGITQEEYDAMSEVLQSELDVSEEELMLFKPIAKKEGSEPSVLADGDGDKEAKKVVMVAGSHLVIVANKPDGDTAVILDYLFGAKKKSASGKMIPRDAPPNKEKPKGKGPDASGSEKGVTAPYKIKIGPLSIGNVGLWFKDGLIGVTLDANLIMGPLGLSLLGFTIGVPFKSLSSPPSPRDIEWGLQGLILAMDKPPLTIAGGFMRDTTSDRNIDVMYTGGLIVGFKPWSFEAMGAYATVYKTKTLSGEWVTTIDTKPLSQVSLLGDAHSSEEVRTGETFTFSFIYVKMNGPLFSVGFADVAGLVGGFGINSDITLPTVAQVTEFPFVAERDSSDESSPVERMQQLMKGAWFRPAEGLYWAAAGARITAFQMLAANIVLILQFGNGNLLFGIFGVATCDVPALEAPVKFAHVELGIVCTFDVNSGIFKFEAQLSPRSFILAPQCHLTGGLALFSWTKGDYSDTDKKNHIAAGDWVMTIGGYHRAFRPPKQYPNPPRLGISWSLSACLSVKGEAYFAITPKVCMGGGKIRAALSLGLLYAWFDAFMDFLMNFDPFYFQMTARVSVGVRFTLDLWLVTIRISVEIGAGLDLMGPPFGGVVHVDFWVFGFDIKFGASPKPPAAIGLDRFFAVATKTKQADGASSGKFLTEGQKPPQPDTAAILLTCETGLLPPLQRAKADKPTKPDEPAKPPVQKEDEKWYVKGGNFTLNASFQFPVTAARLTEKRTETLAGGKTREESRFADCTIEDRFQKVYAKPMQLYQPLTSEVAISVKAPEPRMEQAEIHVLENWQTQKWKLTSQVKPVQSSIWGRYNKNEDPSQVKGPIEGLLNGKDATMQLVTGISIVPPDPAMAGDMVNKFNVTKDHKASVFNPKESEWPLFIGVSKDQEKAWAPKERGELWSGVRDDWNKVGDATTTKAVDIWTKRMRYDQDSVEADQKDDALKGTFEPLRGVAPKKLLRKFEQLVPGLPLVAVGYE